MENTEPVEKIVIKYSSYTPAQKRATQKYRQNNKEKVNEQRKKYYKARKEKDPEFLEYKRNKAKEYYQRKKTENEIKNDVVMTEEIEQLQIDNNNVIEEIEQVQILDNNNVIREIEQDPLIQIAKTKKATKRKKVLTI